MPDSADQLQRLYLAGFELQTFERYPKCIGVERDNCVAVLIPGVDGLQVLGAPGWRMGEVLGVLTEKDGRQVSRQSRKSWKPLQSGWQPCRGSGRRAEVLRKSDAD